MTQRNQTGNSPPPSFDLRRLPVRWQYLIALLVISPIAWFAWHVGKDRPRPFWLEHYLIPFLAWCYIALAARWIFLRVLRRLRSSRSQKS
jgi:hypothetical protein